MLCIFMGLTSKNNRHEQPNTPNTNHYLYPNTPISLITYTLRVKITNHTFTLQHHS